MGDSDVEFLDHLPSQAGHESDNEEESSLEEEKDGAMLGSAKVRKARHGDVGSFFHFAKFTRDAWIPYCNRILSDSSRSAYMKFVNLSKMKTNFGSDVTEWMKMCTEISEVSIGIYLKARNEVEGFTLFNKPLDNLVYDLARK